MPARTPMRRAAVAVSLLIGLATAISGCGSGTPSARSTDLCQRWCGTGSAVVTTDDKPVRTITIAPGACIDEGAAGIDARFGDLREDEGTGDYIAITAYRSDGPTAKPDPTLDSAATPGDSVYPSPAIVGSIDGQPFILGADAVILMKDARGGTFSGTDVNGYGSFSGTFTCG